MQLNLADLLNAVIPLAQQAGAAILTNYNTHAPMDLIWKQDGSPLIAADQISHQLLVEGLLLITPDLPILSEEASDITYSERVQWTHYWLLDPLDGTKEFIDHTADFTVNIALIAHNTPILGVIYAPVTQTCYFAAEGLGTHKQIAEQTAQRIHTAPLAYPNKPIRIIASRSHAGQHMPEYLAQYTNYELIQRGSSLKFCLVAEGLADIYPRLGLTSEWDTAAAQCILEQAGGIVMDWHGVPLRYNLRDSLLNPPFFAAGDNQQNWLPHLSYSSNRSSTC